MPPDEPGFYWALWIKATQGTSPELVSGEWEVVHVVVNHIGEKDDESLAVMVPGVSKWQYLEDFKWGSRIASRLDIFRMETKIAELTAELERLK